MKEESKVCEYCNGTGVRKVLVNSYGFNFEADEPIIENEPCEDCWTAEEN